MTRRRPSAEAVHAARDAAEKDLEKAVAHQLRGLLRDVTGTAVHALTNRRLSPAVLVAASSGFEQLRLPLTLGEIYGAWASRIAQVGTPLSVQDAVRQVWVEGYSTHASGVLLSTSLEGLDDYMASVSDRLVQGLTPPVSGDVFDRVRVATSQAAAQGWGTKDLAQRIAADLSWETDGPYWRGVQGEASAALDGILDPLGPPGSRAREAARMFDPDVGYWQREMSSAGQHLDAERSLWQSRAERIARTESTGAFNFGSVNALSDEGVEGKEWLSSTDPRTRDTHAEAHGQIVRLDGDFMVGGYALSFPGESGGPPEEVVNCRCVVVGPED